MLRRQKLVCEMASVRSERVKRNRACAPERFGAARTECQGRLLHDHLAMQEC
jgi:hypothetical protein